MALKIRSDHSSQLVKAATAFLIDYSPSYLDEGMPRIVCQHDLLFLALREQFFCPSGFRSVGDLYGFVGYAERTVSTTVQHKPDPIAHIRFNDSDYYGNLFHNLAVFGSTLTGVAFVAPSSEGEHLCRHGTYTGELAVSQTDVPMWDDNFDFWGYSIPCRTTRNQTYQGFTVNSVDPLNVTPYSFSYGNRVDTDVLPLLDYLRSHEVVHIFVEGGFLATTVLSNVRYSVLPDRLTIEYRIDIQTTLNGWHYGWDASIVIFFIDHQAGISPVLGGNYVFPATGDAYYNWRAESTDDVSYLGRMEDHWVMSLTTFPILLSLPAPLSGEDLDVARCVDLLSGRYLLDSFKKAVADQYLDIVPSSMFSTAEAFKNLEGSLGTNVLQNLAKIPDISSALPQIVEAIDVLGKIARRDLGLATLREILDLSTSTVLQANFQWRPYFDLLTRYLPAMLSVLGSLNKNRTLNVGYGSYRTTLKGFVRQEVTLLTRTKIVMDTSPSGVLSAILGTDALGLIPKPSALWDLIPFTFAVNWFTGIGASIKRAEYSLLLATMPAYFVHTYTITSPFTAAELDVLQASGTYADPPSLRVYCRDVSHFSPFPRDSRFGFGIPDQYPPLGVFGSLLYQLILG